jgi:hypothetical protein
MRPYAALHLGYGFPDEAGAPESLSQTTHFDSVAAEAKKCLKYSKNLECKNLIDWLEEEIDALFKDTTRMIILIWTLQQFTSTHYSIDTTTQCVKKKERNSTRTYSNSNTSPPPSSSQLPASYGGDKIQ